MKIMAGKTELIFDAQGLDALLSKQKSRQFELAAEC
jgi:hypothetical protein